MANSNLNSARWEANDEYYTVWASVEREMNAYLEYAPDAFRDKIGGSLVIQPEYQRHSPTSPSDR